MTMDYSLFEICIIGTEAPGTGEYNKFNKKGNIL